MVTREFGFALYISKHRNGNSFDVTDNVEDAQVWDDRDGLAKLEYHKAITGYTKLAYEPIN